MARNSSKGRNAAIGTVSLRRWKRSAQVAGPRLCARATNQCRVHFKRVNSRCTRNKHEINLNEALFKKKQMETVGSRTSPTTRAQRRAAEGKVGVRLRRCFCPCPCPAAPAGASEPGQFSEVTNSFGAICRAGQLLLTDPGHFPQPGPECRRYPPSLSGSEPRRPVRSGAHD